MKNRILVLIFSTLTIYSCNNETDLYPLNKGSVDNWFNTQEEIEMWLNGLYAPVFWDLQSDDLSDDITNRNSLSAVAGGTQDGEWGTSKTIWTNSYKAIGRANTLIEALNKPTTASLISQERIELFMAEALFVRAAQYGNLANLFGDIPYIERVISIEEGLTMGKTNKDEVLTNVYKDLDFVASKLPLNYGNSLKRATKGIAYAMKARIAIRNSDFEVAAAAAKACMDLNEYDLHTNYKDLFLSTTKNSKEGIFVFPRSIVLGTTFSTRSYLARLYSGGYAMLNPSWELAASYLCIDGLPIDESSLYDPRNPFVNRDPRMGATIVPVGRDTVARYIDIDLDPSPYTEKVMNHATGKMVSNVASHGVIKWASFNGLTRMKGVGSDWPLNGFKAEPDYILIRYADVLLMYAESKIELNDIDDTVLKAINDVRARAYNGSGIGYPVVTTTDQAELRSVIRFERRMEFAYEELRYNDLIRWKLAEVSLNRPNLGLLDVEGQKKLVDQDLWFFPGTPEICENGLVDYSEIENKGLAKVLSIRKFNERQYLWAIPSKELMINKNLEPQNPGY